MIVRRYLQFVFHTVVTRCIHICTEISYRGRDMMRGDS